ncbi:integrase core domain-containing protein [Paramicrobacterium sp. CJ85]|uniref:integrase core domain-containing protein n=1 Tax=Paramicrobacterium sp. CJ85 TaxID=3445355 RepID=UPI003F61BB39
MNHAHNGKVERYQRILAEGLLYAREFDSKDERSVAIGVWNIHYNYHRRHSRGGGLSSASQLDNVVINLRTSYS